MNPLVRKRVFDNISDGLLEPTVSAEHGEFGAYQASYGLRCLTLCNGHDRGQVLLGLVIAPHFDQCDRTVISQNPIPLYVETVHWDLPAGDRLDHLACNFGTPVVDNVVGAVNLSDVFRTGIGMDEYTLFATLKLDEITFNQGTHDRNTVFSVYRIS